MGITGALGSSGDLRDLESLADDIVDFLPPWQKETAVHRFARFIADEMFLEDTQGRYIELYEDGSSTLRTKRYLPVDVAMRSYGIGSGELFTIPERHGKEVREGSVIRWEESSQVADACYGYTLELQLTDDYDRLLAQMADEVFHTIFPNRVLLSRLHEVLAIYVGGFAPETPADEPSIGKLLTRGGRLKRVTPPRWARRAVFFRDQGHCAGCGVNLMGLIDPLPAAQFDHIVPLNLGGLNDVSNLQLLCQPCNGKKAAGLIEPSTRLRRYYS
ncbi:MAG TPA: HNH endonuclease signature motif containing protein [Acidobacteriaceae bacterium]|nr:HNH endonuclease signature motif containing protein [Acidobacteriaceae bacterium]